MSNFFIVKNAEQLKHAQAWLAKSLNSHGWIKITLSFEKRSQPKNALSHVWYKEIADQMGMSETDAKSYCKLTFGVPILRAESPKFNAFYERFFSKLDYEVQTAAIKYLSVTSVMNEPQMNSYLQRMSIHFAEQGIILTSLRDF